MKSIVFSSLTAVGFALLTTACASNDKVVTAAAADPANAGKVCTVEYKTGSNMPTRECHEPLSDADRELLIRQTRDAARAGTGYKP